MRAKRYNLYKRSKPSYSLQLHQFLLLIAASTVLLLVYMGTSSNAIGDANAPANLAATQSKDGSKRLQIMNNKFLKLFPITSNAAPEPTPAAPVSSGTAPAWAKLPLYAKTANEATDYYRKNPNAPGAALVKRQGETPIAEWYGDWNTNITAEVSQYVTAAARANATPVVVLYNIPQRDCGSYSAGGATSSAAYSKWIQAAAAGIGSQNAVVILEPDAVAGLDCLSSADKASRYSMLTQAVSTLKANTNTSVYLDAGNPAWHSVEDMAGRMRNANISQADGFSLNVSNFVTTAKNQSYGDSLSKLVGGKHYVIDVSRNGNGTLNPNEWCNNMAAALGSAPTTNTGNPLNDALLWVKVPWESDGDCNGGPTAGLVYWKFAEQLAKNAGWQ